MSNRILFKNAVFPDGSRGNLSVKDKYIEYIGKDIPSEKYGETVDCRGNLLMPAFFNAHGHAAMTVLRGYGEELPLDRWLNEKIFPAEDRLTDKVVSVAARLAAAEMIRNGTVSFSDMYMFCDKTAEETLNAGIKANISRGIVSFDPSEDHAASQRVKESLELFKQYNGADDGRILVDFSVHGEYTNTERMSVYVAELAEKYGTGIQLHLSETAKETRDCLERRGMTPTAFFEKCGIFKNRTAAAHCVHVTDEDIDILSENNVYAVHNPVSNLKLGSGIMPMKKLLEKNVRVALGSDGASSNNSLSILKELQFAAVLHKGVGQDPEFLTPEQMMTFACRNGALSQGRTDCGILAPGYRADIILLELENCHNIPCHNPMSVVCYSADNSDILMTVSDGRIIYRDREYLTIDIEKLMYEAKETFRAFFKAIPDNQ